ncbi:ATP-dependent DNA helicase [Acidithiobacillus sp. AMEEHan]|uniref:ATP-dependent DNA helicase n=1 Tax=Acidithiobacillus sp. AMEEHan TaxID=2994951 RepID=UPI0027E56725|nr:ATP-dependent DNA helicase [Acidithiobacillus sp. AMEEHan]
MSAAGSLSDWQEILGATSPLAALLPGFRVRGQQQEMAARVAALLMDGGVALIEAGTGTGKSFAYLLPALLSGRQVIVSTGSRALQDQLIEKDLPLLRQAWPQSLRIQRLKGRSNYLCPYRLQEALRGGVAVALQRDLLRVADWAASSREGDIAELRSVAEDSAVWPLVTSTRDNCLGGDCPEQSSCPVLEARRQAQEAELIVVNHHLLLSDLALKADGKGDLLPAVDALIVDEAHQLPELTAQFFGRHLSAHRLSEWGRDLRVAALAEAADDLALCTAVQDWERAVQSWQESAGEGRQEWRPDDDAHVAQQFRALLRCFEPLQEQLHAAAIRGKGLEQCKRRGEELQGMLAHFAAPGLEEQEVRWCERRGRGLLLHATPLDPAETMQKHLFSQFDTVLLTSATLRIGGDFVQTRKLFGLHDSQDFLAAAPFDYARQALLYLPDGLPEPSSPAYTRACLEAALPVLEASAGRAFFLFTSHRALQEAATLLSSRLRYPLLVQGQAPRSRLLERFRAAGDAVLLGAASFWEGIDVQGEALSTVIIDKLPFASPGDPVLQARMQRIRERGGDPFRDLQIPQAVIALCQGAGRLIRSEQDRGVLMLCDPRLRSKGYGRIFLQSLPPMRQSSELAEVRDFWRASA